MTIILEGIRANHPESILIYCDDTSARTPGLHRGRRKIDTFIAGHDATWVAHNTTEGTRYRLRCDRCGLDCAARPETLQPILDNLDRENIREASLSMIVRLLSS